MPIIKSAIKKMRQDKKREEQNASVLTSVKRAVRSARKNPTAGKLQIAYSALDQAAKKHVIHANKAARLKSRLSKVKSQKSKASA